MSEQYIIHVDMDAFFASVELRDNPSLRGRPLIIGSLPGERGVVATCSYEARKYGVRSAMNINEAYRLCPNATYMHPNYDKYKAVSEQLNAIWDSYATLSERISLDEAYLDVGRQAVDWDGACRIGHLIKQRTLDEVGLTCSVGVAYSKTAAKMASEERKPDGYFEIRTADDFVNLVIDRDVSVLYTVGEQTARKLHAVGIITVRHLQRRRDEVVRMLGKHGEWLAQVAFGIDDRKVTPYRPQDAKSIGREVTFQHDVYGRQLLKDVLLLLAFCVEERAERVGLRGKGVALKVTFGDMKNITRSRSLFFTRSAVSIYQEAVRMLSGIGQRAVRLIGVSLYNLSEHEQGQLVIPELFEDPIQQEYDRRQLLAALQQRYGLDFAGHLQDIYHMDTLHKTIEYMRRKAERP